IDLTAHDIDSSANRDVTGRKRMLRENLIRRDVPKKTLRARLRLGLVRRRVDERSVGQPVERHSVPAARLAPSLSIGVENRARAVKTSQERCLDKSPGADPG